MSVVTTEIQPQKAFLTLRLSPVLELTDEQFFELCQINSDLRMERTAEGEIIVMPLTGGETSNQNAGISAQLGNWTRQDGTGAAFDSSAGFKLPNGADRSPDAAWISHERLAALTPEQKRKFIPLCPDFVVELLSPTDSLSTTQAKMIEYIENGARLGFLIQPESKRVFVYRPGLPVEELKDVAEVSGEPELAGFTLDLREIWEPNL
ncbi:MAG TPA: Uma2 family endonuclease [Blastocatellia bacterium]|nr:Uma2 family endonuclease [Blastocatellia bacterium]